MPQVESVGIREFGDLWKIFWVMSLHRVFKIANRFLAHSRRELRFEMTEGRKNFKFSSILLPNLLLASIDRFTQLLGVYLNHPGLHTRDRMAWDKLVTYLATVAFIMFNPDKMIRHTYEIIPHNFPQWIKSRIHRIDTIEGKIFVEVNSTHINRRGDTLIPDAHVTRIHEAIMQAGRNWGNRLALPHHQILRF